MDKALSIAGIVYAALCVWLSIRVINRRERWAKWTLPVTVMAGPILYVASFGPVVWLTENVRVSGDTIDQIQEFYYPLQRLEESGPVPVVEALDWYISLWVRGD